MSSVYNLISLDVFLWLFLDMITFVLNNLLPNAFNAFKYLFTFWFASVVHLSQAQTTGVFKSWLIMKSGCIKHIRSSKPRRFLPRSSLCPYSCVMFSKSSYASSRVVATLPHAFHHLCCSTDPRSTLFHGRSFKSALIHFSHWLLWKNWCNHSHNPDLKS